MPCGELAKKDEDLGRLELVAFGKQERQGKTVVRFFSDAGQFILLPESPTLDQVGVGIFLDLRHRLDGVGGVFDRQSACGRQKLDQHLAVLDLVVNQSCVRADHGIPALDDFVAVAELFLEIDITEELLVQLRLGMQAGRHVNRAEATGSGNALGNRAEGVRHFRSISAQGSRSTDATVFGRLDATVEGLAQQHLEIGGQYRQAALTWAGCISHIAFSGQQVEKDLRKFRHLSLGKQSTVRVRGPSGRASPRSRMRIATWLSSTRQTSRLERRRPLEQPGMSLDVR